MSKCSICGKILVGIDTHNAEPLAKGRCCGACNTLVIQKRLIDIQVAQLGSQ